MKIRIKGNSVRYRLTKSDLFKLGNELALEEQTAFTGNTLIFRVQVTEDWLLTARYTGSHIILNLPNRMLDELMNTDRVGFSDKSGPVSLLIEKDFTCLDKVEEDQSDNFPNPLLQANN